MVAISLTSDLYYLDGLPSVFYLNMYIFKLVYLYHFFLNGDIFLFLFLIIVALSLIKKFSILGNCNNKDERCPLWSSYCRKNEYVDRNCQKTCNSCLGIHFSVSIFELQTTLETHPTPFKLSGYLLISGEICC